ncbi:polygalacturonase-like [Iris pallida]|uniref:Polygalacturonase-like n=1 Tax=Iris pallida TaxID=29817 RepID=A0AAX6I8Q4_IRIPA|nr:polygalacturonase-like [Iris pallida]
MAVESRGWVMKAYAESGRPTEDHLELRARRVATDAESIPDGQVAVQVLWVSVDPFLRSRMTGRLDGLSLDPYPLGQVITAFGAGRAMNSKDENYTEGDIAIIPFCPVEEYCVLPSLSFRKVDASKGISPLEYLNALGVPGFAAWVGVHLIADPKAGENVFVSAAAGAVGMFAGQLAKLKGCRVVGSAGTDEKVNLLKEELNFDDAFNYNKETDFDVALSKYFPDGIDVYFENVGGEMLEAVLNHVNKRARIPLCGMISQYNQVWTERQGIRNLLNMVGKDVKMEGFMIGSYIHHFGDFAEDIEGYIREGKLVSKFKMNNGIESFLPSLVSLFSSSNVGKVIIEVNK